MKIIALDLGESRTGVALCEKDELIASPLTVINEKSPECLLNRICEIILEKSPDMIVVGHPVNMDGSRGERAEKCVATAERISSVTGIETVLWDERCTTVMAHGILSETGKHGKKRKQVVDAVAATLILESFLDYRRNRK